MNFLFISSLEFSIALIQWALHLIRWSNLRNSQSKILSNRLMTIPSVPCPAYLASCNIKDESVLSILNMRRSDFPPAYWTLTWSFMSYDQRLRVIGSLIWWRLCIEKSLRKNWALYWTSLRLPDWKYRSWQQRITLHILHFVSLPCRHID